MWLLLYFWEFAKRLQLEDASHPVPVSMNLVNCNELIIPVRLSSEQSVWLSICIARNCRLQLSKSPIYVYLNISSSEFSLQYL